MRVRKPCHYKFFFSDSGCGGLLFLTYLQAFALHFARMHTNMDFVWSIGISLAGIRVAQKACLFSTYISVAPRCSTRALVLTTCCLFFIPLLQRKLPDHESGFYETFFTLSLFLTLFSSVIIMLLITLKPKLYSHIRLPLVVIIRLHRFISILIATSSARELVDGPLTDLFARLFGDFTSELFFMCCFLNLSAFGYVLLSRHQFYMTILLCSVALMRSKGLCMVQYGTIYLNEAEYPLQSMASLVGNFLRHGWPPSMLNSHNSSSHISSKISQACLPTVIWVLFVFGCLFPMTVYNSLEERSRKSFLRSNGVSMLTSSGCQAIWQAIGLFVVKCWVTWHIIDCCMYILEVFQA